MPQSEWLKKIPLTNPERAITFDDFVGISNSIYKTIGMIPYDNPGEQISLQYKLITTGALLILFTAIMGEIIYFILSFGNFGNFLQMTALLPCIFFCINGFTKILTILNYREQMNHLVDMLKDLFPKTPAQQKKFRVQEYNEVARYIFRSFSTFMIVWIWTFNLFALFLSTFQYFIDGAFHRRLPYYIWHPYNWNNPWIFELTYLYHISAGHCAMIPVLASDLLVGGLVTQICMHFDALNRRLESLQPRDENANEDMRELIKCIKMQSLLYDISDRLEAVFSFSILVNFIASVIIVCLCGFQLTFGTSLLDTVIYGLFLPSNVYQIFFLSFLGNQLIDASQGIASGAYGGQWYNATNPYRKYILLMIARSQQRPQVLTALKFSVVSLQSFNKIMSTSYSYFALLRTIYSD